MRSELRVAGLVMAVVSAIALVTGAAASGKVAAAAPVSAGGSARELQLINGMALVPSGHGFAVVRKAAGPAMAGALTAHTIGGHQYAIPLIAMPYLGRGLDPSLFDLAALAAHEAAGRIPVRVAYHGTSPPVLPGVMVTHAAAGTATGYLTVTSAGTFGAALWKQYLADHSRASYGSDGLFASGVSIALAGAAVAIHGAAVHPRYPMHTLTMRGIDPTGRPDTGDEVVVLNVDDATALDRNYAAISFFYDGTAKYSVPSGRYWAFGMFPDFSTGALHLVALPQFTVSGNTTVTVDARTADSGITFSTPRPATVLGGSFDFIRTAANGTSDGEAFLLSGFGSGPIAYISPVSKAPSDGTVQTYTSGSLVPPPGSPQTYAYQLVFAGPQGTVPVQHWTATSASLATVHENLYSAVPMTGNFTATGWYPAQGGGFSEGGPLALPARYTVYLSSGNGRIVWQASYFQEYSTTPGMQFGAYRTYQPGQVVTEAWNDFPLRFAPHVSELTSAGAFTSISADRAGNTLTLNLVPFGDSTYGHTGVGYGSDSRGTYRITENGKTIASGNALASLIYGTFYHQVKLGGKPSTVAFTLTASRTARPFPLSTAITTTWTWQSVYAARHTVPAWWSCTDVEGDRNCVTQPLLTLGYAVASEGLDGLTAPGAQQLTVTPGHLQLAAAPRATEVSVQVSFDDGKTWHAASVTKAGAAYHASFAAPKSTYVTLRVIAADAAGGRISETITRAWATAA
jgi:hypothetical protein